MRQGGMSEGTKMSDEKLRSAQRLAQAIREWGDVCEEWAALEAVGWTEGKRCHDCLPSSLSELGEAFMAATGYALVLVTDPVTGVEDFGAATGVRGEAGDRVRVSEGKAVRE